MAREPKNDGKAWTGTDKHQLRQLARQNTPTRVIGLKMGRTEAAVRTQASKQHTSLKPTNQSPYGTRGKSKGR